ncbi:hypothetical protein ACWEBX_03385 [Streptomyces sp. NPDC005070]
MTPDHQSRSPRHLTVRQAGFLGLLAVHGTVWLLIAMVAPSLHAILTCLSSYLAVLAALSLLLSARPSRSRSPRRPR